MPAAGGPNPCFVCARFPSHPILRAHPPLLGSLVPTPFLESPTPARNGPWLCRNSVACPVDTSQSPGWREWLPHRGARFRGPFVELPERGEGTLKQTRNPPSCWLPFPNCSRASRLSDAQALALFPKSLGH